MARFGRVTTSKAGATRPTIRTGSTATPIKRQTTPVQRPIKPSQPVKKVKY